MQNRLTAPKEECLRRCLHLGKEFAELKTNLDHTCKMDSTMQTQVEEMYVPNALTPIGKKWRQFEAGGEVGQIGVARDPFSRLCKEQ